MSRKLPYYTQLLLSYVMAVSLPVILLCAVIYSISYTRLEAEMIMGQRQLLTQGAESLNLNLRVIGEMTNAISMDNEILNLSEKRTPDQIMQSLALLRRYIAGNAFLSNVLVSQRGERTLFTADGTVFQDVLLQKKYGFSTEESIRFASFLSDRKQHLHFFEEANVIMRFMPLPVFAKTQSGSAVFVIGPEALSRLFTAVGPNGAILLLDGRGKEIFRVGENGAILSGDLLQEALLHLETPQMRYGEETYHLISAEVAEAGWTLLSVLPSRWIKARLYDIIVVGAVAAALLLAVALSFWAARNLYKPIRVLGTIASVGVAKRENELESIHTALSASLALSEQVALQRAMLQESLLLRLLEGDTPGREEMEAAFHTLDLPLKDSFFRVAVFRLHGKRQVSHEPLMAHIRATYAPGGRVYAVEHGRDQALALLIRCGAQEDEAECQAILNDLCRYAFEAMGAEGVFGVGTPRPFTHVAASYLEARVALDCPCEGPSPRVVHFASLQTASQFDGDFQRHEMMFAQAIQLVNREMAYQLLEKMLITICGGHAAPNLAGYYRLRLVETAVRLTTQESFACVQQEAEAAQMSAHAVTMLSPCPPAEYAQSLRAATELLLELAERSAAAKANDELIRVERWIVQNVCDPNLSLDMLSEEMGFSAVYWSRFCRERLHIGFHEHVWRLRLSLAKEALAHTTRPVKQIVMDVGYLDVSSFIRRFKQDEGVTPGQYREIHKGDSL